MILSPIPPHDLDQILATYRNALPDDGIGRTVFDRIAATRHETDRPSADDHRAAVQLAATFGMQPLDEEPQQAFSWDGACVRTKSEAAVLIHEVAHFQLAFGPRRFTPDFGLGAGPETGLIARAEAARVIDDQDREEEEQMASLLGILWEVALGQAGILAFLEQNWLEGAGRRSTAAFFIGILGRLQSLGLIDDNGTPLLAVRISS